jgi:hypothetical protein
VDFIPTTTTVNPGNLNSPVAQYAVFGESALLTTNTLTLTLQALYGSGAGLCGLQILPAPARTPLGVPYAWFGYFGLATNDLADPDLDGSPAWKEFFAGTDPTNAFSSFRVLQSGMTNGHMFLSWLGGTSGYLGKWSVAVSTNLTDWTMITSRTIPRDSSGTNFWTDFAVATGIGTKFYRPCVEHP